MRKSFYLALLAVPILLGGCDKTDNTGEEGEEKGNPSVNIITVTGITNLDP